MKLKNGKGIESVSRKSSSSIDDNSSKTIAPAELDEIIEEEGDEGL